MPIFTTALSKLPLDDKRGEPIVLVHGFASTKRQLVHPTWFSA